MAEPSDDDASLTTTAESLTTLPHRTRPFRLLLGGSAVGAPLRKALPSRSWCAAALHETQRQPGGGGAFHTRVPDCGRMLTSKNRTDIAVLAPGVTMGRGCLESRSNVLQLLAHHGPSSRQRDR